MQEEHELTLSCRHLLLHLIEAKTKAPEKCTLVLCHGFPDCSFGWRKQINALTNEGYRLLIPDLPGYGKTKFTNEQASNDLGSYGFKFVTQVLADMLDAFHVKKAVFIGHDWGGEVVYRMCLYHPDRVSAVASLCTPYTPPRPNFIPLAQIVKHLPMFKYQQYFCDNYLNAKKELEGNVRGFFIALMRSHSDLKSTGKLYEDSTRLLSTMNTQQRSSLLSEEELDYYVNTFTESGFGGALNWYRTRVHNWENEQKLPVTIPHPVLMVTAGKDYVLPPSMSKHMESFCANLKRAHVEYAAHWIQVEQSDQVNQILLDWLTGLSETIPSKL